MLQYLRIKNFALLKEVSLEFDSGFTVVTGETGAGKSIFLGALRLLAGNRVDKSVIHQDASACEVEASFFFKNPTRINALIQSLQLPLCEDGSLILKRTLFREKNPRIQINDSLATLSALQKLGEYWIDFHGPGEPQKLFQERFQLNMLDLYAGLNPLIKEYQDAYQTRKALLRTKETLTQQAHLSRDETDFIQSQITKIDSIDPTPDSIQQLEQDSNKFTHAQEIVQLSSQIENTFAADEAIITLLQNNLKAAQELATIDPSNASALAERIETLIIESEDLAQEYNALAQSLEFDPSPLHETQTRMNLWLEIQRQYGPTLDTVLHKRNALSEKLSNQSNIEENLQNLQNEIKSTEASLQTIATPLNQKRKEAAKDLAAKVTTLLKSLGFQKAAFAINILLENEFKAHGNTKAEFLFSPNAGQNLMPLNKIASSGETARVMLAIKTLLAKVDETPLLVFDEVDANVGGEISLKVAQEMARLAKNHQVLCVTHLPQVASKGLNHFTVNKLHKNKSTEIMITALNAPEERTQEIARMLGDKQSLSALNHARELLCMVQ